MTGGGMWEEHGNYYYRIYKWDDKKWVRYMFKQFKKVLMESSDKKNWPRNPLTIHFNGQNKFVSESYWQK